MIGAMYENGGNTTHRFLDGHPGLYVYPFESQLGTRHVVDPLTSMFPAKYRWPVFPLAASPADDFESIIDEETRVRARTPHVSKFRDTPFDFDDGERKRLYLDDVGHDARSRAGNVAAFFRATFDAWHDHRSSGEETFYVGYSPIVTVDAELILTELPEAQFLHVVRNPWSAYADTKKRPVPLSLPSYLLGWTTCQHFALSVARRFESRFHLLRLEDLLEDPEAALAPICRAIGVGPDSALQAPSWNGSPLDEIYPWGTIRHATPEANRETAAELTAAEADEVASRVHEYLAPLGYEDFVRQVEFTPA